MTAGSLDPSKAHLRAQALARREALSEAQRAAAALAVAQRRLPLSIAPGSIVAGYHPIRSEFDSMPLMRRLAAQGARLALPVIVARDLPLRFRAFAPGDALAPGLLGILEPAPDAADVRPDLLLVPLAAFDRQGHRIGYGAGHYDRTLAQLRESGPALAVGLAFAVQEIASVPVSVHDVALDLVLTEQVTLDFRSL
jgi:5-formyltetrahydrofolate cyclo-ligase